MCVNGKSNSATRGHYGLEMTLCSIPEPGVVHRVHWSYCSNTFATVQKLLAASFTLESKWFLEQSDPLHLSCYKRDPENLFLCGWTHCLADVIVKLRIIGVQAGHDEKKRNPKPCSQSSRWANLADPFTTKIGINCWLPLGSNQCYKVCLTVYVLGFQISKTFPTQVVLTSVLAHMLISGKSQQCFAVLLKPHCSYTHCVATHCVATMCSYTVLIDMQ